MFFSLRVLEVNSLWFFPYGSITNLLGLKELRGVITLHTQCHVELVFTTRRILVGHMLSLREIAILSKVDTHLVYLTYRVSIKVLST